MNTLAARAMVATALLAGSALAAAADAQFSEYYTQMRLLEQRELLFHELPLWAVVLNLVAAATALFAFTAVFHLGSRPRPLRALLRIPLLHGLLLAVVPDARVVDIGNARQLLSQILFVGLVVKLLRLPRSRERLSVAIGLSVMLLAELNAQLRQLLTQSEQRIRQVYADQETLEREIRPEAERELVYRDLHDDLGARLLSLVYQSNQGAAQDMARTALQDPARHRQPRARQSPAAGSRAGRLHGRTAGPCRDAGQDTGLVTGPRPGRGALRQRAHAWPAPAAAWTAGQRAAEAPKGAAGRYSDSQRSSGAEGAVRERLNPQRLNQNSTSSVSTSKRASCSTWAAT